MNIRLQKPRREVKSDAPGAACAPGPGASSSPRPAPVPVFRRIGWTAYGFGLFSDRMTCEDPSNMLHLDDVRIDQGSLRLSTELWEAGP